MLFSCYYCLTTATLYFGKPLSSELDPKWLLVQVCGLHQYRRKEKGSLKEPLKKPVWKLGGLYALPELEMKTYHQMMQKLKAKGQKILATITYLNCGQKSLTSVQFNSMNLIHNNLEVTSGIWHYIFHRWISALNV